MVLILVRFTTIVCGDAAATTTNTIDNGTVVTTCDNGIDNGLASNISCDMEMLAIIVNYSMAKMAKILQNTTVFALLLPTKYKVYHAAP